MDKFLLFMSSIRWQDAADVILNSYLVFRLYVLFRGTIVFRVLIGIAFLWFFQRISTYLGLIVTSWAVQGITAAAALIIIVIFRNEIRSVLQATNLKAILWGFPHKAVSTPVEILVESAYELARKRTGALIVLPGEEDIEDAVHNGISWQGLVSKEMIMSIFWHDNPVHDGAAIIKGDQVKEVGVILPLSYRKDLPSYYGTRHRAAAGLAEITDALAIVVSEERGNVAVAKGLSFRVIQRREELAEILREHVGIPQKQRIYRRSERFELGLAALVSVLFIAGVWVSFTRGIDTLITLEIPVEYVNRDPGMEIFDTSVNTVSLDLSGSGALIKSLRPGQVKVRLDLSEAVVGQNTVSIAPENITHPPGVFLKNVTPPVVQVTLDVPVKKGLPIQVDWVGKLPEHVIISGVTLDPEKVQIIGGSRMLENISTIYTEEVSVDDIESPGTISVKLAPNPTSLKLAPDSKDRVDVEYTVRQRDQ